MINCDVTVPYLKSFVSLDLPQPAGAPELYELDAMRAFVEQAVSVWEMAWCSVGPYGIREASGREGTHAVFASWLVHLDNSLIIRVDDLPSQVSTVDAGNGTLFVMAPTPADLTLDVVHAVAGAVELDPDWELW
jgi:hypothetical protein